MNKQKTKETIAKVLILYFSGSGSTDLVARRYEKAFRKAGHQATCLNIARNKQLFEDMDPVGLAKNLPVHDILLVGGPIYIDHMHYHLLKVLNQLPIINERVEKNIGGVFTTFGKLSPGVGLAEAASILSRQGRRIVSALEVDCIHSASRAMDRPISPNLPDESLNPLVESSVATLLQAFRKKATSDLTLLLKKRYEAYPDLKDEKPVLDAMPRVTFDPKTCISCGRCVKACPVLDLSLKDKLPIHRSPSICIGCTNCLVVCPTGAVDLNIEKRQAFLEGRLREEKLDPNGPSLSQLYMV